MSKDFVPELIPRNSTGVIEFDEPVLHIHMVESITHRPPPNNWHHCRCGWWPPKVDGERQWGDPSEEATIAHIEEATGEPYVAGQGIQACLVGPPRFIDEHGNR